MSYVTARDGTRLHVAEYRPRAGAPKRPTILCLSGVTRTSRDFSRLAPDLAEAGHRVLALDYRGRGRSGRALDPDSYAPTVYLDDIRQVLFAFNIHRVVVIGTSLGGFLTMGMAVAMPTVLAGAVLNDCGPDLPKDGVARIADYIADARTYPDWSAAIDAVKAMLPDLNLDEDGWRLAAEGCFHEEADGRVHADWDPRIAAPMRRPAALPDLWPMFKALRPIPCLAFRGELSSLLSDDCFRKMRDANPDLRQTVIANRGHAPTLDEPEARSAIHAFLASLS
ncbi:alpha/beta fold hydrolase [Pacificispira sp.]|uniref:alpha/beta fold hydrolase n=1 Tax=Pacificispira sp. TaxID=2888761 RepID=UPI003BADB3CB